MSSFGTLPSWCDKCHRHQSRPSVVVRTGYQLCEQCNADRLAHVARGVVGLQRNSTGELILERCFLCEQEQPVRKNGQFRSHQLTKGQRLAVELRRARCDDFFAGRLDAHREETP